MIDELIKKAREKGYIASVPSKLMSSVPKDTVKWDVRELTCERTTAPLGVLRLVFTHRGFKNYKFLIHPALGCKRLYKLCNAGFKYKDIEAYDSSIDTIETIKARLETDDDSIAESYIKMCKRILSYVKNTYNTPKKDSSSLFSEHNLTPKDFWEEIFSVTNK